MLTLSNGNNITTAHTSGRSKSFLAFTSSAGVRPETLRSPFARILPLHTESAGRSGASTTQSCVVRVRCLSQDGVLR
ncbi:hypothetical protein WJX82_003959 [Trebouxia sp. C0006]